MTTNSKGTALVTGASSGIGAIYADRLARRGHDLVLVARSRDKLDALARRIADETGRGVETVAADLNDKADLKGVEDILRENQSITTLVNNAGFGAAAPLLAADVEQMAAMISLNVTALTRLTYAAAPAFVARGGGTIINVSSIAAISPEALNGVYGGTKAFVLALSQSLHKELAERNIRIQAVLPGVTETGFWDVAGVPMSKLPSGWIMTADAMVDAALVGLDQGELVTIPALPDAADWNAYEAARQKMAPNLSRNTPASRYAVRH